MSQETNTRKLSKMGRRRFLKNLSKIGVSATTLSYITQDSLAKNVGDLDNRIPIVKEVVNSHPEAVDGDRGRDGRAPVYDFVERDKWNRHVARQKTLDALLHVLEMKGYSDVSVGETTKTMRNRDSAIHLTAGDDTDLETLKKEAPKEIDILGADGEGVLETVPIYFDDMGGLENYNHCDPESDGCHYAEDYRPLAGGCKISMFDNDPVDDERYVGTAATPAKHNGTGKNVLVTAGHNLKVTGDDTFKPHPMSAIDQPKKGNEIAGKDEQEYLVNDEKRFDVGYIELDEDIKYNLANEDGGYGPEIQGIVDKSYMKFMVGEGDTSRTEMGLKSQTIYTNRSDANVDNVFAYEKGSGAGGCDRFNWFLFETGDDWKSVNGESGAPIFNETSSGVTIAGILKGGMDNVTYFCSMTDAECYFNITVNPGAQRCGYEKWVNYYDSNDDCSISIDELDKANTDWVNGKINMDALRNVISAWVNSG